MSFSKVLLSRNVPPGVKCPRCGACSKNSDTVHGGC